MTCPILEELKAIGVEVLPHGSDLVIRPASKVPPELKERLRAHKAEVLAILKAGAASTGARRATCSPTCYEVEPGRWVHHPRDGCRTVPQMSAARSVERECWHCSGGGKCRCIVCCNPLTREAGECVPCKGTGKVWAWLQ
jgi:hypothetical protein